jgi:ribosomal-protein-alanine N-acetyltransferase
MILTTERLRLRPIVRGDLDVLATLYANPEVMQFSLGLLDREQTREKLDRILESMATRGWDSFVVELLDGDHFVGICGLAPQTVDGINEVELGYRLMPEFWGRGMATEAACACRDYAFKNLGMPRVIAIIEAANAGSIRVTEKVGLRFEKETRKWDRHVQIFSAHADGQFEMPT